MIDYPLTVNRTTELVMVKQYVEYRDNVSRGWADQGCADFVVPPALAMDLLLISDFLDI